MDIDVHAHFFNTRHLPLAGVARHWYKWIGPGLAGFLDFALTSLTANDPTLDEGEKAWTFAPSEGGTNKERAFANTAAERGTYGVRTEVSEGSAIDAFVDLLPHSVLESPAYDRMAKEVQAQAPQQLALAPTTVTGHDDRREFVRRVLTRSDPQALVALGALDAVGEMLQFMLTLLASERRVLDEARAHAPSVGLFVHLMMDMENGYGDTSYYGWRRSIARTRRLAKLSDGRVVPFVAFDPFRTAKGADALPIVIDALSSGFAGVKFYPPTGYRPIGNPSDGANGVSGQELDARNMALFEYCAKNDIPILSHCTPRGMQANRYECSGHSADPAHWEPVLRRLPNLRLCFAHLGGQDYFLGAPAPSFPCDTPQPEWADRIASLCSTYEHVYCDAADLSEVVEPAVGSMFADKFAVLLGKYPRLGERVMYGSDFPMPAKLGAWGKYYGAWRRVFSDQRLAPHAEHFFHQNAANYLNLQQYLTRNKTFLTATAVSHLAQW